jgi:hypothetical protein
MMFEFLGALRVLPGEIGSVGLDHRKLANATKLDQPNRAMRFTGPAEFNPFVDFVIFVVNRIGAWQHGARLGPIRETQPARPGNERVAVITSDGT